jgi:hypothetical protein
MRRARYLFLAGLLSGCLDPYALDEASDLSTVVASSTSEAETAGAGTTTGLASSSTGDEVGGSGGESSPVSESVGDRPSAPVWGLLSTKPHDWVLERGPLETE